MATDMLALSPTSPTERYRSIKPTLPIDEQPTMTLPIRTPSMTEVQDTRGYQPWYAFMPKQNNPSRRPLELQEHEFAALYTRLRAANRRNRQFKKQYAYLDDLLRGAVVRLSDQFADEIDQVVLTSPELINGIDLRELGYGDVVLTIVLLGNERPYSLYRELAKSVFARLDRSHFLPQFSLVGGFVWRRAVQRAARDKAAPLGITLLRRV